MSNSRCLSDGVAMESADTLQITDVAEIEHLLALVAAIIARLLESGDQSQPAGLTEDA